MLNDLYEILKESLKKLLASRTFILGVFLYSCSGSWPSRSSGSRSSRARNTRKTT